MNKTEFVRAVAEASEITKKDTEAVINGVIAVITDQLKIGEKITIPGFGSFEARKRTAREGINPKTGEKIKILETRAPAFKPGATLKEAINKK